MSDEVTELRVENERLRELLREHGIDPEPETPEPPRFGPPTEWEWRIQRLFSGASAYAARMFLEENPAVSFLSGSEWPEEAVSTLRIRLPTSFNVIRAKP